MTDRTALLERYGRFYGEEHFAVAFTAGTEGANAKRVVTKGWDSTRPLASGDFAAGLIAKRGQTANLAIVLRPSNLIVIECDSEEDLVRIESLALPVTVTARSSEPYKRHFYFRPDPNLEALPFVAFRFESGKLTADSGRYFVAPPSLHPSGAMYDFLPGLGPDEVDVVELPEAVYRDLCERARSESSEQRERIAVDPEAKIFAGQRRDLIFRYACMLRRWGRPFEAILEECHRFNLERCEPPVERDLVVVQVRGAMKKEGDQELAAATGLDTLPVVRTVTLDDFIAVEEPGAAAILGSSESALIPANGDVMLYGDGGVGKTTLAVDLAFHLAAGEAWLGIDVPAPVGVLLVENEGPRPLFRKKLGRKRKAWDGGEIGDRLWVLEAPWAMFTFAEAAWRERLAEIVQALDLGILFVGPLVSSGMEAAGTLQEVRAFIALVDEVRLIANRELAVVLVHHENKGGKVSGAWEGAGDTLLHAQQQGHGKLRLYVQKARWAGELHATSLHLAWAEGDSFERLDDQPATDQEVYDVLASYVLANGGKSFTATREAIAKSAALKTSHETLAEQRDVLLAQGVLVNRPRGTAKWILWHRDDPEKPSEADPSGSSDGSPDGARALRLELPDGSQDDPSAPEGEAGKTTRPSVRPPKEGDGTRTDGSPSPSDENPLLDGWP